ncbi:hypothetical protein MHB77_32240 [Paenibacillus sp. FSL K6-3166]|uniref:hypothetical protein n=1 Tax=unclassified Paenibacillus TaxID=185978 RepID=UPI000BA10F5C|nr:hypothetical protein [Paenibacillus sp. VTT E-133291]OZQ74840.1 hypothetical protein CA598_31370 [Paenibacillus sp. VTT E-133291]
MAKYNASPLYSVASVIEFNADGTYETEVAEEIALLDSLTPTWIKRVDAEEVPEEPVKPTPKPRKAANTSAK